MTATAIIDCNANLGNWPFRRMSYNTPEALLERLGRVGIERAWVTLLDAVMLKNVGAANPWLAELVAGREALTPVGSVNPTWPAWERDVAECAELGFAGVRVNPNYHGWELAGGELRALLSAAGELGLFVEIAVRMTDERHHHPLVMVPPTSLGGLAPIAGDHPEVPIIVANAKQGDLGPLGPGAQLPANLYFEMSHFESVGGVQTAAESLGVGRILFGTHAPYYYPESSHLKVFQECAFPEEDLAAITHGNAERLLAGLR